MGALGRLFPHSNISSKGEGAVTTSRQLIIMQPTPFCNINCRYCYLPERTNNTRMTMGIVDAAARAVFSSDLIEHPVAFVWHLGEPLAVPIAFYEEAFEIISAAATAYSRRYFHTFQTNATLLTPNWVSLIAKHQVGIGVSLDGPAFIHDRSRVSRKETGTHADVMRGVELLRSSGVSFGAISVLTEFTLHYPDDYFLFFLRNGISDVGMNIDEIEGHHRVSTFATENPVALFKRFIIRLLELSEEHQGRVRFRELYSSLRFIASGDGNPENATNRPLRILNITADGSMSTFCPELLSGRSAQYGNFAMSNVLTGGIDALLASERFRLIADEVRSGVEQCKAQCDYWAVCGGGSPSNKFFEHGRFDVTETVACRFQKKAVVDAILDYFEAKTNRAKASL